MLDTWLPDWLYMLIEFVLLMFVFGVSGLIVAVLIEDTFDRDCEGLYKGSVNVVIVAILFALLCLVLMVITGEVKATHYTRC